MIEGKKCAKRSKKNFSCWHKTNQGQKQAEKRGGGGGEEEGEFEKKEREKEETEEYEKKDMGDQSHEAVG